MAGIAGITGLLSPHGLSSQVLHMVQKCSKKTRVEDLPLKPKDQKSHVFCHILLVLGGKLLGPPRVQRWWIRLRHLMGEAEKDLQLFWIHYRLPSGNNYLHSTHTHIQPLPPKILKRFNPLEHLTQHPWSHDHDEAPQVQFLSYALFQREIICPHLLSIQHLNKDRRIAIIIPNQKGKDQETHSNPWATAILKSTQVHFVGFSHYGG